MSDRFERRPSPKIFISNLNMDTTEDDLRKEFRDFGTIVDITLKFKDTGITYAFIEYDSQSSAERAVTEMNQQSFMGKELKVQIARGKSDRDRGGFRSRGGNRDSRPQRPMQNRSKICYNCQEDGHFARDCTNPRKERERKFDDRGGFKGSRDRGDRNDYRWKDDRRDRGDRGDRRDFRRKRSRSAEKYRSRSRSRSYEKRRKYRNRSPSNSSHS